MLGADDGLEVASLALGLPDGDIEGIEEGTLLGEQLGTDEGALLGMEEGTLLGALLGTDEGALLGVEEGTLLGALLGTLLGIEEGAVLGMAEGFSVQDPSFIVIVDRSGAALLVLRELTVIVLNARTCMRKRNRKGIERESER